MDTRNLVADKLRKLIADYLEIDVNRVVDEAHLSDDLGVDWLDQIDLLIIIEDEFEGVQFSEDSAIDLVGDLVRYIEMTSQARNHPGLISADRRSAACLRTLRARPSKVRSALRGCHAHDHRTQGEP